LLPYDNLNAPRWQALLGEGALELRGTGFETREGADSDRVAPVGDLGIQPASGHSLPLHSGLGVGAVRRSP
jgi:hypothetical protein